MEREIPPIGLYQIQWLSVCNPQVRWVERVDLDYLGRHETLQADAIHVAQQIGAPLAPLPHHNRSLHGESRSYYCTESRQIIESFYAEDFRHFGYPTEAFC